MFPFGATLTDGGVNFSIFSKEAKSCTLLLYHHGQPEPYVEIPFPEKFRIGDVYAMMVFGIQTETTEYGYRFDGEYDPRRGLRFDAKNVLLDPYAKSVSGRSVWGKEPDWSRPFQHRGQFIREDYSWEGDKPLEIAPEKLVIYELHVRSFTCHETSGVKHRGTFAGLLEKIPYLRELGVNCVELMPVFEFDEFENAREYNGTRLLNYWGYSTVNFFAPKAGYAASAPFGMEADELKNLIRQLHRNGIEVILDVVLTPTGRSTGSSFRSCRNPSAGTWPLKHTAFLRTPEQKNRSGIPPASPWARVPPRSWSEEERKAAGAHNRQQALPRMAEAPAVCLLPI